MRVYKLFFGSFWFYGVVFLTSAAAIMPFSPDEKMRGELKLQGIEASTVDWIAMDALCSPLHGEAEAHRLCMRDKALDKRDYLRESASCRRRAAMPQPTLSRAPFGFAIPQAGNAAQNYESMRRQHMAINLAKRVAEDPSILDYSYESCMEKLRWRNPFRWQEGREPLPQATSAAAPTPAPPPPPVVPSEPGEGVPGNQ